MRSILKPEIFCILVIIMAVAIVVNITDANARKPLNPEAETLVKANAQKFETMLNDGTDPKALMDFLHNTIDQQAKIHMTIDSPQSKENGMVEVTLDKAEYINSYLYGPRQVENYQANINARIVEHDEVAGIITSKDMVIESGTVAHPNAGGQNFTSTTTCETTHKIAQDSKITPKITMQVSKCHTKIAYEQAV